MEFLGFRRISGNDRTAWRTYAGGQVAVHALENGYAAKHAQAELRIAQRIVAVLEDLCKPTIERREELIEIYLLDPVGALPGTQGESLSRENRCSMPVPTQGTITITRYIRPEDPGEPIVEVLPRLLIQQWFGPAAASAALFLDGITGIVATRIGIGPALKQIEEWVRSEVAAGRTVSIFASMMPNDETLPRENISYPATAFVAFLIKTFGTDAISQFLARYDPDRRDQAALSVFHRPLGALEEAWLAGLRRRSSRNAAFRSLFGQLVPLVKPYWRRQLELLGYMLIGLAYSLGLPLATKYLVDTLIPSGRVDLLLMLIGGLFGFYILNFGLTMRRAYVTGWLGQHILIQLQEKVFAHLQRLPHTFYIRSKIGDLVSRLSSDITIIQQAMMQLLGVGLFLVLRTIGIVVALLILSPLLGVIVLTVVPLFTLSYLTLRSRLQHLSYEQQQQMGENTALVQENLSAHAVVKAFGLEERMVAGYRVRLEMIARMMLRLIVVGALFEMSLLLAVTMGELLILGIGGYLVIQGQLTIGTLIAFIGLLPALIQPVATLAGIGRTVQTASGSLDRVIELLDEPMPLADKPEAATLPLLQRSIRLEHVSFGYDTSRLILNDLNVTIPAGAHVAIVGPSGSGKSTIVNLMVRFWDPTLGRVCFDDYDLREVSLSSLRSQIGIVFQDTFIFDTTLRENIALGHPTATDAEIAAAAKAAQLDSYIATLPNGYDTLLGERGARMSGGQRQRLAIARALLRNPRILIFDEATSALDAQTEREILETMLVIARERTTISITHRLALAARSDRIIVLDQGRVVEEGSHATLAQAEGLYQRLYDEQMGHMIERRHQQSTTKALHLQAVPFFANLSSEALEPLAQQLEVEHYPANAEIVVQGDAGDKLYIIKSGHVEVLVAATGLLQCVNELGPNDYFGEMALLTAEPRRATIRSTQPTTLYSLKQTDFTALLDREPDLKHAISETVAARQQALRHLAQPIASTSPAVER